MNPKYFPPAGRRASLRTCWFAFAVVASVAAAPGLLAQEYQYNNNNPPPSSDARGLNQLPPIEQLAAPIALYPDPIVALILPAATEPEQLSDAARDPQDADHHGLSPAVQGLSHYPELLRWMASNADWTRQIGAAFAAQPHEVMDGIQDLRRRAMAAGTLRSGPQDQVVQDNGIVQILPAKNDVVYLPRYNPDRIYFGGYDGPAFSWSGAEQAGPWLAFYPAWDRHEVWSGDWNGWRRFRSGDDHRQFNIGGFGISLGDNRNRTFGQPWRPRQDSPAFHGQFTFRDSHDLRRPGMMNGAPGYRSGERRSTFAGDDYRGDDRNRDDRNRDDRNQDNYRDDRDNRRPDDRNRDQYRNRDQNRRDQQRNADDRRDDQPRQ